MSSFQIHSPVDGQLLGEFPESDLMTVVEAIQQVASISSRWQKMSLEKRKDILLKTRNQWDSEKETIQSLLCSQLGYPIWQAKKEVKEGFKAFDYFLAKQGEPMSVGLAAVVGSTSSPFYYFCSIIVPALLTGTPVLLKPAPQTSGLFDKLQQGMELPDGLLHLLHGRQEEILEALASHPAVKNFCFMGNFANGKKLIPMITENWKKWRLDTGGRNSVIIGRDCELENFENEWREVLFSTHFLSCYRGSRVFVSENRWDEVVSYLNEFTKRMMVGEPHSLSSLVGPLSCCQHVDDYNKQTAQLKNEKANVHTFGEDFVQKAEQGCFVSPVLVEDISHCAPIQQDELIGPAITLTRYKNIPEATKFSNTSKYGLCTYIFSDDESKAQRWAKGFEVGKVFINSSVHGIHESPTYCQGHSGTFNTEDYWDYFQIRN